MSDAELEQRLAVLEKEFHALKQRLPKSPTRDWRDTFGAFADDPGFDEILRLGREIRRQDRQGSVE
jgi:hypothetical protein